jgi:hypothetical protein
MSSFASRSVHEVSKRLPPATLSSPTEKDLMSAPYKAVRLAEDFGRITRSLGIVANLRSSIPTGVKEVGRKKSKTTFYVNNFMRSRYSKTKDGRPLKVTSLGLGEKQ